VARIRFSWRGQTLIFSMMYAMIMLLGPLIAAVVLEEPGSFGELAEAWLIVGYMLFGWILFVLGILSISVKEQPSKDKFKFYDEENLIFPKDEPDKDTRQEYILSFTGLFIILIWLVIFFMPF